ncbi:MULTISPECIES: ABC transporter ATP-binding protein [Streptomyces]|uniref:Uncharacterized protein n=1 Tax=Streptomyces canarius TaxID=285453 RepID=A0ABQ3CR05_9ACTN|nr:ABC transporter ATP-binding protein [Streptomyces canarius]GHA33832.1 hypothetical protein GCM10010345_42960 [Streptomyces canarius]
MTESDRLTEAQSNLCNTFFALAGDPDSAEAIAAADRALWALDDILAETDGTPSRTG